MSTKQHPGRVWVVAAGVDPLPHIGPGPLTDAEMTAAEDAYLSAHFGAGVAIPAGTARPRSTGGYVQIAATVEAAPATEPEPSTDSTAEGGAAPLAAHDEEHP